MANMTTQILWDGVKGYKLDNPAAFERLFANRDKITPSKLYATVAILNRCTRLRTDAVAHIPFALKKGDTDLATSDDWEDSTGTLPHPKSLLRQFESSLLFSNAAYAYQTKNKFGIVKGLQYFAPTVTTPLFDDSTGELLSIMHAGTTFTPEEVLHIWYQDGLTEVGPAAATVMSAAASAAGVLSYLDQFVQSYFQHGAIRVTILGVPQGTSPEAKKELETWWSKAVGGIKNMFGVRAFNVDAVKPTVIGDGIDGLANNTLTVQEREDIATAFGVPMSMVLSNAANFATATQDERNLIQWSVLPDCELIAEALTEQVYSKWDYQFEFRPETMDSFQEDEVNRAQAFGSYVTAGILPSIAAQIVGIELPADVEYEDLDPEEPEPQPIPEQLVPFAGQNNPPAEQVPTAPDDEEDQQQPPAPSKRLTPEIIKELQIWERKAIKSIKAGGAADCDFVVQHIEQGMGLEIHAALKSAQTPEEVKAIFDKAQEVDGDVYLAAARELTMILRDAFSS